MLSLIHISDTRIDEALLLRYFEGEVTLSEKDEIEKWIISSEANKKLEMCIRDRCCMIIDKP